jgi:hypothetical protein
MQVQHQLQQSVCSNEENYNNIANEENKEIMDFVLREIHNSLE